MPVPEHYPDWPFLCFSLCTMQLKLSSVGTGCVFGKRKRLLPRSVVPSCSWLLRGASPSMTPSGLLGFLVTLSAVKLKSLVAPGQCAAWLLLAQVATAGSSVLLFEGVLTRAAVGCLLLGGLGEALLLFSERRGAPR
uniref:Transmembrane protein 241 n=1 Tax=Myotis myotis TaxID=51298 RepID=A0A7J7W1P5_MYOMY|nr:transmembrane protein 241 [Myotis myotis]